MTLFQYTDNLILSPTACRLPPFLWCVLAPVSPDISVYPFILKRINRYRRTAPHFSLLGAFYAVRVHFTGCGSFRAPVAACACLWCFSAALPVLFSVWQDSPAEYENGFSIFGTCWGTVPNPRRPSGRQSRVVYTRAPLASLKTPINSINLCE